MKAFDDYDYTRDAILKQLVLIELHGKDGSAVDAGCQCINTKHTYMLEGLCEEMAGFAKSPQEKQFYLDVADLARVLRKKIDAEDFSLHGAMRQVMKIRNPLPKISCEYLIEECVIKGGTYAQCRATVKCPA